MNPDDVAKLITEDPDILNEGCPVCGSRGEATFTGYACSNKGCQNYDPRMRPDPQAIYDAVAKRFVEIKPGLQKIVNDHEKNW